MLERIFGADSKLPPMKKLFGVLAIGLCLSFHGIAQQAMEDVVYLKDGSIYRGQILEMVPNGSLKIETAGGNVFAVKMSDVEKTAKEERFSSRTPDSRRLEKPKSESAPRPELPPWKPRLKGYFFQSQIMIEALHGGVRIVNGYKFGRFGYLGIGVGVDNVIASPSSAFNGSDDDIIQNFGEEGYRGIYLPLYLFHQGDILKKKITPFYAVEAGYALAFDGGGLPFDNSNGLYREGGIMGGAGIGVRFNSRSKRTHFSLLLNVNVKNVNYDEEFVVPDEYGWIYPIMATRARNEWLFFPGIRLGIGF